MKILLNVLADRKTANGSDYDSLPFSEINITLKQGNKEIYSGTLESLTNNMPLQFRHLNDDKGFKLKSYWGRHNYDTNTKKGTAVINIPIRRMTDSVTFTIILEHTDYFIYNNTFTVFGYDLGQSINFGTQNGTFSPINQEAIDNNIYNPIYNVSNGGDVPLYGGEDGSTLQVRHNSPFDVGLIPKMIDDGTGTMISNDLRYKTSGRFIAIKNPTDENVFITNGNSNHPTTPPYIITYGVKKVTETNFTYSTFPDFSMVMEDEDYHIAKFFSIGSDTPEIQTTKHIRTINIIPNDIKKVNGQDISSFTGELNGLIQCSVNIDETSVFYFWSNNYKGISAIASAMLEYVLKEVTTPSTSVEIDRKTSLVLFHNADKLNDVTQQLPYSEYAHDGQLNSSNNNILVTIEVNVHYMGNEIESYKHSGSDTVTIGSRYMIASNGVLGEEDYSTIGAQSGFSAGQTGEVFTCNNSTFNFAADGALYHVEGRLTVPKGFYGRIKENNVYFINEDITYDNTLFIDVETSGFLYLEPIHSSGESIQLPYSNIYSITSVNCGTVRVTVYGNTTPTDITVEINKYDDNTNEFTHYDTVVVNGEYNNVTEDILLPDGIYKLSVGKEVYLMFSTCTIINCYVDIIKNAVCSCCEHDDCKAKAYYRFNEFMLLWNTYLAMISVNENNFTFIDSNIIDYSELLNYIEISKLQNRIIELCNNCKDITKKCKNC